MWSKLLRDLCVFTLGARKSTTSQIKVLDLLFLGLHIDIMPYVGGIKFGIPFNEI